MGGMSVEPLISLGTSSSSFLFFYLFRIIFLVELLIHICNHQSKMVLCLDDHIYIYIYKRKLSHLFFVMQNVFIFVA
jgi:hypothetical protein